MHFTFCGCSAWRPPQGLNAISVGATFACASAAGAGARRRRRALHLVIAAVAGATAMALASPLLLVTAPGCDLVHFTLQTRKDGAAGGLICRHTGL